jgi:hypothetical protein
MFIRRDGIVSTGFPGHSVPWKRPSRGAEGVVESKLVAFCSICSDFFPIGLAGVCGAGLRPAGGLARFRGLVELGVFVRCVRFDRPVSVE